MKTNDFEETALDTNMENIDAVSFRGKVLDTAKQFKTNWLELAKHLFAVKNNKYFKEWGYISFDTYCAKELAIKKQTAFKLLSSYYFLTHKEPQFLEKEILKKKDVNTLPSFEAIDILRRAKNKTKKGLSEEDYSQLKESVLEESMEPREVGKQLRSMLWAARPVDPEAERINKRVSTIKRFLGTLKALKKEVELLKVLPDNIISDTDKIIYNLESELEQMSEE